MELTTGIRIVLAKVICSLVLILGVSVMLGWVFHFKTILSVLPGAPTMKFNTALLMVLSALSIIIIRKRGATAKGMILLLLIGISAIATYTIISHLLHLGPQLDNLFYQDTLTLTNPGRMSIATAVCFILLSLAVLGARLKPNFMSRSLKILPSVVILIALLVIITYILQVTTESKVLVFRTMAIHTAILFIALSFSLSLTEPDFNYVGFLSGNYGGSKLARSLLPFSLLLPLVLSFFLLYSLHSVSVDRDFNITIYTLAYAAISFVYINFISYKVNKADEQRTFLENSLSKANRELWQYKYALDKSSIVAILDENGFIKEINSKFSQLTGYEQAEMVGKKMRFLSADVHGPSFFKKMWAELQRGKVWVGGIKKKTKSGEFFWVHSVTVPFKDEKGAIYQYLTIQQDVSRYYALAAQYDNLIVRNKEIEQFTYIASHDLQEPLRNLTGISEILLSSYTDKLDETGISSLKYISESANRMSTMVKGLLDFSRLGIERELVLLDTSEVIKVVKQDLRIQIKEADASIIELNSAKLYAYKTEFRLLIQNLISNAIKFKKPDEPAVIEFDLKVESERYIFSVKDNGLGIKKGLSRSIFAIFKTAHVNVNQNGSGIGLAHCDKIVQLHGGEIWYTSELNVGSVFYFSIPKM